MARVWPFGLVLGVSNNVSVRIWLGLKHFFYFLFIFRFKGL